MTWRYLGFAEPSGDFLGEVEVSEVQIARLLSGPDRLSGRIKDGQVPDWLRPWECSIYAEDESGTIMGGGFVAPCDVAENGDVLIDCLGRAGYPKGQPWVPVTSHGTAFYGDEWRGMNVDPLIVARVVWDHLQTQPGGNVRMRVDTTTQSPVRVGTPQRWLNPSGEEVSYREAMGPAEVVLEKSPLPEEWEPGETEEGEEPEKPPELEFTITVIDPKPKPGYTFHEAEPFTLSWWETPDLGDVIDRLSAETPFDYLEHTTWNASGTRLEHRLLFGYPQIGVRRDDLRLAIGENVVEAPNLSADDDAYASTILALGAGEGRTTAFQVLTRTTAGVRRVARYVDKTQFYRDRLAAAARADLGWRDGTPQADRIIVLDSEAAPLSTLAPGVEVLIVGGRGAARTDRWVRVTAANITPDRGVAALDIVEV